MAKKMNKEFSEEHDEYWRLMYNEK